MVDPQTTSWIVRFGAMRRLGKANPPPSRVFPGGREPDSLDFDYCAFVVGMTSQLSDIAVASRSMRHLILVHGVLAFLFNIAVLALSTNIIASVI